jgi:hypothetical protein
MLINQSQNSFQSRRITSNTPKAAQEPETGFGDGYEVKASFEFKTGAVTLADLAGMLSKKEDGGYTLSIPNDVLVGSEESARPEIISKIDALTGQPIAGVKHTTRGLPRTEMHSPSAPRPFNAGRFQVDFGTANGPKTGVIFETEAGPGHLANVVPGETPIEGGYISFLSDPGDSRSTGATLNKAEEKHLLTNLYSRFSEPMTQKDAQTVDSVISYAFAIHHKEGGAGDQVQASHREMAAEVAAKRESDSSASDQWILR